MSKNILSVKSVEIQELITLYINSECILEKASLLWQIRDKTRMGYIDLEEHLFNERRTLIRINSLNNLIPEILELLRTNVISKIIAYQLGNLSADDQFEYFLLINDLSEMKKFAKANPHLFKDKTSLYKSIPIPKSNAISGGDFLEMQKRFCDKEQLAVKEG
jgi:hypothetical protein